MVHFTYNELDDDSRSDLMQGDILKKTPELTNVLNEYHSYYSTHEENIFFIVLTQSCDLALRNSMCKSRYITLAPVRTLSYILKNHLKTFRHQEFLKTGDHYVSSQAATTSFTQFVERILNNNEQNLFFLRKRSEPEAEFTKDCCALLQLPVSIKSIHYQKCLKAKLFGLNEVFRAKLGWLTGDIYSRVGTEDWPKKDITDKTVDIINNHLIEIDKEVFNKFKRKFNEWQKNNPDKIIDRQTIQELANTLPTKQQDFEQVLKDILMGSKQLERLFTTNELENPYYLENLSKELNNNSKIAELRKETNTEKQKDLLDQLHNDIAKEVIESNTLKNLVLGRSINEAVIDKLIIKILQNPRIAPLLK